MACILHLENPTTYETEPKAAILRRGVTDHSPLRRYHK
jgi:hypothetical protein